MSHAVRAFESRTCVSELRYACVSFDSMQIFVCLVTPALAKQIDKHIIRVEYALRVFSTTDSSNY